jgi:hypothetical protein
VPNRCLVLVASMSIYSGKRCRLPCTPGSEARLKQSGSSPLDIAQRPAVERRDGLSTTLSVLPCGDRRGASAFAAAFSAQPLDRGPNLFVKRLDKVSIVRTISPGEAPVEPTTKATSRGNQAKVTLTP